MARRRRFSEDPFGETLERLMTESGATYRALASKTKLSAGYLNHLVHGNRPVPSKAMSTAISAPATASSSSIALRRPISLRSPAPDVGCAAISSPCLVPGTVGCRYRT